MMAYLTRPSEPTIKESEGAFNAFVKGETPPNQKEYLERINKKEEKPYYMTNLATGGLDNVNAEPKRINLAQGTAKNQKKIDKKTPLATEKNNIVIAMSETPSEEFQLDLSAEIEQFQKWLKENKNGTYQEFLKDKTALLTEEQKNDPKIIDLEPYLPQFEDVIKQYEKEQEEKKETLEQFINRRSKEMMLAESDSSGVSMLLKLKKEFKIQLSVVLCRPNNTSYK